MRSDLLRRKSPRRQKYVLVPVIFFGIAVFILCSGELDEEIRKEKNIRRYEGEGGKRDAA